MNIPLEDVVRRLAQRISQLEVDLAVKDCHIALLEQAAVAAAAGSSED